MKKILLIVVALLIVIIVTVVVLQSPNKYKNVKEGFEFNYPKKTFVYAVDKMATTSYDIVFSVPEARATEIPLARISISTHDSYSFPTMDSTATRDHYPFEGFHKLTSEKVINRNPIVIEFTWTDNEDSSLVAKEYRVVKINKNNVTYFDLENGQGFTPEELRSSALSFRFDDLKK